MKGLSNPLRFKMLPTIRPTSKDDPAEDTDEEMLGEEETDERANLLGGKDL